MIYGAMENGKMHISLHQYSITPTLQFHDKIFVFSFSINCIILSVELRLITQELNNPITS